MAKAKIAPEKKYIHSEFNPVQTETGWTIQKGESGRYVLREKDNFLVSDINPEVLMATAEGHGILRENWKNI